MINYSTGYVVVDTNPNSIPSLQSSQKQILAVNIGGSVIWKFVSANPVGSKWVEIGSSSSFAEFNNLDALAVGANLHNLAQPPSGVGYRLSLTADIDFTGIAGGWHGQVLLLFNASVGPRKIKVKHNNGGSSVGSRIAGWDNKNGDIKINESTYIRYDLGLLGGNGGWHRIGVKH